MIQYKLTTYSILLQNAILGLISSVLVIMASRYEVSKLRREIKHTEEELMNLRALPIKDKH